MVFGRLERIGNEGISGWALDRLDPRTPLKLRVCIDGRLETLMDCAIERADLAHLHLPASAIGFEFTMPWRFHDGLRHVLTLFTLDGAPVRLPDATNRPFDEIHFQLPAFMPIDGVLDGLIDGVVQGWAVRTDRHTGGRAGGVRLLLSVNGEPIAELLADQFRWDVAEAKNADPCCGFSYILPPGLWTGRIIRVEVHAMPGRVPLRNSPLEIAIPPSSERARILALIAQADALFRFAHQLQKGLRASLPAERYSLADYETWAGRNAGNIAPRAAARYGAIRGRSLVSILCPVFRPRLADFCCAVDSVRAQSYANWELILVDDGSADPALDGVIAGFMKADSRIRGLAQAENSGIAAATNRALAEALGEFTVFLDHDDLLAPEALEAMLRAQSATGARLLYSDEDKISQAGRYCEPNLKPDFNYRLLLELNYICHLVMVETALARELGGFDSRFDGAQDHEFLLRLCERLEPGAIHHVPEILYHWRISASSVAMSASAKPGAAEAGVGAVASHLARRGLAAEVTRRGGIGCYRVVFPPEQRPAVSILIPFRDHIEMTRDCVDAIRRQTRGVDYEILLLDNWSATPEAEAFCAEQANLPDTRVLRIAEPFNFSRINNLGAAAARHDLLLFLNNDVLARQPDWLRILAGEVLSAPENGAAGAKLLYPDGTVQHAGVVLGIGGVADHAFRGLRADAPGYIAHAISAREVSAVTAACMLVRREAFVGVGGFDEAELAIAFNDIDLCIRLRNAGWRIVFTPECAALHQESRTRGDDLRADNLARFMRENQVMLERWGALLPEDPFYNRHFARDAGIYRDLRVLDPEAEKPFRRSG